MYNQQFNEYEIKRRRQIAEMSKEEKVLYFYSNKLFVPTNIEDIDILFNLGKIDQETRDNLISNIDVNKKVLQVQKLLETTGKTHREKIQTVKILGKARGVRRR